MRKERWKQVDDHYWVSSNGRVYSATRKVRCGPRNGIPHMRIKRGCILGMNLSPLGYYRVNINGNVIHVHTLVAKAFLGAPTSPGMTVNHIDLDKTNNRAENLEWISSSGNVLHAWENGACSCKRAVLCVETGEVFGSVHEAARSQEKAVGNLCSHLKGRQKTFSGKRWEYVEVPDWPSRERSAA